MLSTWRTILALLVVMAALGGAAGGLWGWHRDSRHSATAVILVNPLEGSPFSPAGQGDDLVNLETEAQLVTSDSVTTLAAKLLPGSKPVDAVRAGVSVTVPTNTQLLRIRAVSRSVADAVRRAQAFAQTYLTFRQTRTESLVFDRNSRINAQLRQLGLQLEHTSQQLSQAAPRSSRGLLLQQQVTELTSRIGTLHTQLVASQSTSTDPGQLVTPAAVDPPSLLAGPVRSGAAGAAAAVLLCAFLLLARGRLVSRVQDAAELEQLGVSILPHDEQLAGVRARLLAAADHDPVAVLVATCGPTMRRSATALPLACAFGRANLETVLVEAVEYSPGADHMAGLSDLLQDRLTVDEALAPLMAHLQLLTSGTEDARLDDLVAGVEMSDLLTDLRKRSNVIVLSAGPLSDARTQAVARLCDVTVLEVAEGSASLTEVEASLATLDQCGGALAGLLMVPATKEPRRRSRSRRD